MVPISAVKKLNAIVVDDDFFVIEGLKTLVDWNKAGIAVSAFYYDGISALEHINQYAPDILITDISMPLMDGLQLVEKVKQSHPDVFILFLTAYESFEYVKHAIELHAEGYILKPIDYADLCTMLKQHSDEIRSKMKARFMMDSLYKSIERLAEDLVFKWLSEKDLNSYRQMLLAESCNEQLHAIHRPVVVLIELFETGWAKDHPGNIFNTFRNIVGVKIQCSHIIFKAGRCILGLLLGHEDMANITVELFQAAQSLGITITVSAGNPVNEPSQAMESYHQARQGLAMSMVYGPQKTYLWSEIKAEYVKYNISKADYSCERLIAAIHTGRKVEEELYVLDYIKAAESLKAGSILFMAFYFFRKCLEMPGVHADFFNHILSRGEEIISAAKGMSTLHELKMWLMNIVIEWHTSDARKKSHTVSTLVGKVMEYVNIHLQEELTLKDIATRFFISPNYLGRVFREETREGFGDYVKRCKMERICECLNDAETKVYEIAHRMGYKNLTYFHNKFKEYYGLTPGEYRKRIDQHVEFLYDGNKIPL